VAVTFPVRSTGSKVSVQSDSNFSGQKCGFNVRVQSGSNVSG
jgi:hypothetical protein